MPLSSTGVFTCMSCGGLYVTSRDKPVAIAGRLCHCDPEKRPARFHGPQFGVPQSEHDAVKAENADLRSFVKWAYDAGFTPKTMSRDMHRKLAGLSPH